MEMHQCKLCFREFLSGNALGGHMSRSHVTKLPLPPKIFQEKKEGNNENLVDLSESTYVLRENPRKSFKVIDPEFFDAESVVVQGGGSEAEKETDESELKTNEDVALFLLMLSRGELKIGGKHRCEVCRKVFKSSQALGGHRRTHRNLGVKKRVKRNEDIKDENVEEPVPHQKIKINVHECPHCGRSFVSGQALGGHKRSHYFGNPSRKTTRITTGSCSSNVGESLVGLSNSEKFQDGLIDLNFPAPMDDDYGDGFWCINGSS